MKYFIRFDGDFDIYDSKEERDKELQRILDNDKDDIIRSEIELVTGTIDKEYVVRQYDESEFEEEELEEQYNGEAPYYLKEVNYDRNS